MSRRDIYEKFQIERNLHSNYQNTLNCPYVFDPYKATFLELIEKKYAILDVQHKSGKKYYCLVTLKPQNWLSLKKERLPPDDAVLEAYTFSDNCPIGYTANTIERLRDMAQYILFDAPLQIHNIKKDD